MSLSLTVYAKHYHDRALRHIRKRVTTDVALSIVSTLIGAQLDYCNAISNVQKLRRVQNSIARIVTGTRWTEQITLVLAQLLWLPIELRIQFKLCLLKHLIHTCRCPSYITSVILCNSLLTMLVVQILVLLQFYGTFYKDLHYLWGARLLVLWPQGLEFASGSISFDWIDRFFKKKQLKTFLFNPSV